MSGTMLTWLSTIAWCLLTGTLFLLLARWSVATSSWTILPGLVRGVREWVDRSVDAGPGPSPRAAEPDDADAADPEVAEIIELRR